MINKAKIKVVAGVIFNEKGEILLASRPKSKIFADYWEFPGGKVEAEESDFAALVREFNEVTGLIINDAESWLHIITEREDAIIYLHFFRIRYGSWSGNLQARENQNFVRQNPQNINVSPILPNNEIIIHALQLPEKLSGGINGIYDENNRFYALPYERLHLAENAAELINYQGKSFTLHAEKFWATVRSISDIHDLPDAEAFIWLGSKENFNLAAQQGFSQPVYFACKKFSGSLKNIGAHGIILWQENDIQAA